jgi:hypothetical protein
MKIKRGFIWILPGVVLLVATLWCARYLVNARRFDTAVQSASTVDGYDFLEIKTAAGQFAKAGGGQRVVETALQHDGSPYSARIGIACVEGLASCGAWKRLFDICCAKGATSVAADAALHMLDNRSMPRLCEEDVKRLLEALDSQSRLWPVNGDIPGYLGKMNRVRYLSSLIIRDGTDQQVTRLAGIFAQHPVDLRTLANCRVEWKGAVALREAEAGNAGGKTSQQGRIARVLAIVGVSSSSVDAAEKEMTRSLDQAIKKLGEELSH